MAEVWQGEYLSSVTAELPKILSDVGAEWSVEEFDYAVSKVFFALQEIKYEFVRLIVICGIPILEMIICAVPFTEETPSEGCRTVDIRFIVHKPIVTRLRWRSSKEQTSAIRESADDIMMRLEASRIDDVGE